MIEYNTVDDVFLKRRKIKRMEMIGKALSHPTIRSMYLRLSQTPQTVTELYCNLRIEQTVCSQFLGKMRDLKLVKYKREGKNVRYSINKNTEETVFLILKML
tara:strand:- start:1214 stop:1519 length:306 start_codon:yes stop_codon:yes gene_type:complete